MRRQAVLLFAFAGLIAASLVAALPERAEAASTTVSVRDNVFSPEEVRIDPGDTVLWAYDRGQNTHTVTSDERGEFASGDMRPGETYSHTFSQEGYYPYFCRYHGGRGGAGMAGLVIVGDPPEPPPTTTPSGEDRPRLVVPTEFPTIQKAADAANPGSTIVIRPGVYREAVIVKTPRLVIKGVDRFRTVLHGGDSKENGIIVDGVHDVTVKNLTVRNFLQNGVFFNDATGYAVSRVDSIKNRTYGIYAFNSYDGIIKKSFGWGSGDSAFYVGQCLGCSALIENVHSEMNYLGYSGTNATGVVIRDSTFVRNGAGVVPNTLPTEELSPNRGTTIIDNVIENNNYENIPAAGFSENVGIPFGTGVWLAGVHNNIVKKNVIRNHNRYGVLITQSIDEDSLPMNNRVRYNLIRSSRKYDLAWDGTGANNCFYKNDFTGPTGPPEAQTIYACPNRPFVGVPFPPVQADVAAAVANSQTREQEEPPEPDRPRCQKGAPGCTR
ncbi:MAG: plastocyanin/azurin family copper-binding protein [Actinomycetota bacterium]|nr:plastocyanin/azurin family copper-binding protein [Actinomycetota bacterium]